MIMKSIIKKLHWDLPRDSSAPLRVYSYGLNEVMKPGIVRYGTTEHDWLFIFFNDEVQVDLGRGLERVPQDSLVVWSPDDVHCYGNASSHWRHSWIHVAGRRVEPILNGAGLSRLAPLQMSGQALVENYFLQIFNEISLHQSPDDRILENLFECWLLEMSRAARGVDGRRPSEAMRRLKHHIDLNVSRRTSLSEMAGVAALSIPHMCAEFRNAFGTSPMRHLIGQRINLARHLLRERGLPVSEVADQVGYPDIYQFSKMFKKIVGLSPRAYRSSGATGDHLPMRASRRFPL